VSKVYFTSDTHFGHASIVKFVGQWRKGSNSEEHDEWLIEEINKVVRKRDVLYILGDIAMGKPGTVDKRGIGWYNLSKVGRLNGTKKFILGNHDDMTIEAYRQYAQIIRGMDRYKGFWLSHCPIHPQELRGRKNIHGHVHANSIPDDNYINVCVEANMMRNGTPIIEFEELKNRKRLENED